MKAAKHDGTQCPLSKGHRYEDADDGAWRTVGSDRVCSFCGSWHPDEFIAFCRQIINGEIAGAYSVVGLSFAMPVLSVSDRRHKIYARREGVTNASQGAIKVYVAHLSEEQGEVASEALRVCYAKAAEVGS